jgi:transposase
LDPPHQPINQGDKHVKKHSYIGLDVPKESISIAVADGGRDGEVREHGTVGGSLIGLERALGKLKKPGVELHCVYEAGPCGFVISRRLKKLGIDCEVVAPSLIPRKPGERIKTNRRDALKLARSHRAGELTPVHVPEARDEAIRDLCRARTDAVRDQRRSRQQLKALLLRLGYHYTGKSSWTEAHLRYLRELELSHPAQKVVLEEYLIAITQAGERIARLNGQIELQVATWRMKAAVEALMALRGIQIIARQRAGERTGRPAPLCSPAPAHGLPRLSEQRAKQRRLPSPGSNHQMRQHSCALLFDRVRPALRLAAQSQQRAEQTSGRSTSADQATQLESTNPAPPSLLASLPARALPAKSRGRRGPRAERIYLGHPARGATSQTDLNYFGEPRFPNPLRFEGNSYDLFHAQQT